MGIIRFRCTDELVSRLEAAAVRSGLKGPDLCRAIFERALSQLESKPSSDPTSDHVEADSSAGRVYEDRSARLYSRLTPSEYRAVESRAVGLGMTPYKWTARLIRAHLINAPQLSDDETRALRETTRELSYIGRNLNQVAHALNMTLNAREKATFELIDGINTKVNEIRDAIKVVLDQNLNRWGV